MSWRDDLLNAGRGSFRGVEFVVASSELSGGRKVHVQEYPGADVATSDDYGRRARRFSFEAIVAGRDYLARKKALLAALEIPGPGLLVHPYWGEFDVVAESGLTVRETSQDGGAAAVRLRFVEVSATLAPTTSLTDQLAALENAMDALENAASEDFADNFDVSDLTDDLADHVTGTVEAAAELLAEVNGQVAAGLNAVNDLTNQVDALRSEIQTLLDTPSAISNELISLAASVMNAAATTGSSLEALYEDFSGTGGTGEADVSYTSSSDPYSLNAAAIAEAQAEDADRDLKRPIVLLDALDQLGAFEVAEEEVVTTTPTRQAEASCLLAVARVVHIAAVAEAARASTLLELETRDQAEDLRDALAEDLDEIAATDGPLSQTSHEMSAGLYDKLAGARAAIADYLNSVAGSLPETTTYTPEVALPALVIAHELYGDPARADEIVRRNNVPNPLLVPRLTALEVVRGD